MGLLGWCGVGLCFCWKIAGFCEILVGGIARLKGFGVGLVGFGLGGLREIWVAWKLGYVGLLVGLR